jgi:hypothetical protein
MLCCYDYAERRDLYSVMLNVVILYDFMLSIVASIKELVLYAQANIRLGIKIATDKQSRFHVSSF